MKRKHQTDLNEIFQRRIRNKLFPLCFFHVIRKNKNQPNGQPETNLKPIESMKRIQQGNAEKKNENHKALTEADPPHKKNW